jgi:hypothetical protein
MATVAEHYRTHLAPVYAWMAGGVDAAVARGESEIAAILPDLSAGNCRSASIESSGWRRAGWRRLWKNGAYPCGLSRDSPA